MTAAADTPAMATGLPPGWIELAAFPDERTLLGFLDTQIDADGDLFTAENRAMFVQGCLLGYRTVRDQGWLHLGAVATWLPGDDGELRTTVWTIGVGLLPVPSFGDVNPVGVAERVLGSRGDVGQIEPFELVDGREGIVIGATTSVDVSDLDFDPVELMPHLRPDELGVYIVVLPMKDLPTHLGVTVGIAPNVAERTPMSVVASQMATSLQRLDGADELPADLVLVDTTRTVRPEGFMPGTADKSDHGKADDVVTADL
ncbi:hypothetical protein [Aeromicrobium fastidiosum]|uniref:Uncharacterized protein n=1 Tax=Aeromicrobium fastidiosum TaxID=52699 RepID=A0A641AGM7_9ACTN|nr:hypothetical protein [Aeromicrobium fastidiosum]KAA1372231.1 hypothetical protein ESP62_019275 [Aeromicrobium fastidiosum]MBP2391370.1 hypothetical protein [Aeromicrobium fastidiosum]